MSILNNNGGRPGIGRIGSFQGIDNIEVTTTTFKVFELWTEQKFLDDRYSVLFGVHDSNTEFQVTDMGANFILPTFGQTQDLAQTGENGPSTFPTNAVGVRFNANLSDSHYFRAAAYNAVSGSLDHQQGTRFTIDRNDGALLMGEVGFSPKDAVNEDAELNKIAIGAWAYTKSIDDLVDTDALGDPIKRKNRGAYIVSSRQFYKDVDNEKSLGVIARAGLADADVNQTRWSMQTGLVANGWVKSRPDSEIGLAYTYAGLSDKYKRSIIDAGGQVDNGETIWELYYRDELGHGFSIQPDIQYVVNPGGDPAIDNALAIGLRVGVEL